MKKFIKTNNLDLDIAGMVTQDLSPFTYKVSLQWFGVSYLMNFIKEKNLSFYKCHQYYEIHEGDFIKIIDFIKPISIISLI